MPISKIVSKFAIVTAVGCGILLALYYYSVSPTYSLNALASHMQKKEGKQAVGFFDTYLITVNRYARLPNPPRSGSHGLKTEWQEEAVLFNAYIRRVIDTGEWPDVGGDVYNVIMSSFWQRDIEVVGDGATVTHKGNPRFVIKLQRRPSGHWVIVDMMEK